MLATSRVSTSYLVYLVTAFIHKIDPFDIKRFIKIKLNLAWLQVRPFSDRAAKQSQFTKVEVSRTRFLKLLGTGMKETIWEKCKQKKHNPNNLRKCAGDKFSDLEP